MADIILRGTDHLPIGSPIDQTLKTPYFNDYLVPGFSLGLGASAPSLKTFRGTLKALAFAGTGGTTVEAFFVIHILHDIKQGTDMTFHAHWGHIIAVPSGNVKWQVDYSLARAYNKDVFPAVTSLSTVQEAGAQYDHHLTEDDDMTISAQDSIEPDSIVLGRVYRDPTDGEDTFEDDAFLLHIDLHYQGGSMGTTERNRPWESTNFATS